MPKKLTKMLLIHTLVLLASVVTISIVNYKIDGGWTAIIIIMCVLIPQFLFVMGLVIHKVFSKAIVHNWFLVFLLFSEAIGMAFIGMESLSNILSVIGFSLLYISIAISWIILTYYNGTWGKYKPKTKAK